MLPPDFDLASRSLADGGSSPESAVLAKERVAAVWSVVETLSARQRTVFLLRFVEDLDLLEIAAVTGHTTLAEVERYTKAGVTHFIFMTFAPFFLDEIQGFAEEVIPAVRGKA